MDLRQANKEGWSIQMRGATSEKIVWVPSYTPRGGPTTDHDASAFVRAKAEAGSAYHIEALAYVAFTEPTSPFSYQGQYHWINILNTNYIQTS